MPPTAAAVHRWRRVRSFVARSLRSLFPALPTARVPASRPLPSRALPHPTVFRRAQNIRRFRSFASNVKSSNAGTVQSKRARSAGTYTGAYIREYKQTIPYLRHRSRRSYVL